MTVDLMRPVGYGGYGNGNGDGYGDGNGDGSGNGGGYGDGTCSQHRQRRLAN